MNQSEIETLPKGWLSRIEGHPWSETHALTLRVEDDALVAK